MPLGARAVSAVRGRCSGVQGSGAFVELGSGKVLRGETADAPVFRGELVGRMAAGGVMGPRWIGGAGGIDVGEIEGDGVWGRFGMRRRMAAGNAGEVRREMGVRILACCVAWNGMIIDWRRSY